MPKRMKRMILCGSLADYRQLVLISIFFERPCEFPGELFNVLVIELVRSNSSTFENLFHISVMLRLAYDGWDEPC